MDDELTQACAKAARVACRRMTPPYLNAMAAGRAGGARTRDRQIMRSTLDRSICLTSNDAMRSLL
jgi:hypothetical protein